MRHILTVHQGYPGVFEMLHATLRSLPKCTSSDIAVEFCEEIPKQKSAEIPYISKTSHVVQNIDYQVYHIVILFSEHSVLVALFFRH